MELLGIGNKFIDQIDKHSSIIGGGLALLETVKKNTLINSIGQMLGGNVHAPNFTDVVTVIRADPKYLNTVIAIIGGYVAQQSGIAIVDKIGKIAVKAGSAYLAVSLADLVLWNVTHSPGYPTEIGNASPTPTGSVGYAY